jgi:hypothetical protein
MFTNENMQRRWRPGFGGSTLLALLITGFLQPSFAESAKEPSFTSAEQAVEALYKAVETDDQATISRLVGPLSSSDDVVQDKADRQLFVQKYSEMHRLVKEPDGHCHVNGLRMRVRTALLGHQRFRHIALTRGQPPR